MRKLVILTQIPVWLSDALAKNLTTHRKNITQAGIFLPIQENHSRNIPTDWQFIPFSNAKSLLGSEFPFAFYYIGENPIEFNLDAFAILAGTIQRQGCLYLICPHWDNLSNIVDQDALRWNENNTIPCPTFYHYFKSLIAKFGFSVESSLDELPTTGGQKPLVSYQKGKQLTEEQQNIFENLPLAAEKIHLITAPRGRGKSTLAGKLAKQIAKHHSVVITARSRAALMNFWKITDENALQFFAPDALLQQIEAKAISPHQWLFIDEAASLPLPFLHQFCAYFDKIILTTTTHNYEGTGRGFSLKFLSQTHQSSKHWTLTKPLRWQENDPLEAFVDELLLLDEPTTLAILPSTLELMFSHQKLNLAEKIAFYQLLAQAHYKTTPTDLRRLLDGKNQQCFCVKNQTDNSLIGGIWAINEGGINLELTQAIWKGERRPQGNLVAQYLCFQGNLPEACELRSLRISRIAVEPQFQQQGIGKRSISEFILQIRQQKQPLVDFISVSFGMSESLYRFWQQCGFTLVQITPTKEASSGYPSAMMLYPLTTEGKVFCQKAQRMFERDLALNENPNGENAALTDDDWKNIEGFAKYKRTLTACYASLKRLYLSNPLQFADLAPVFENVLTHRYNKSQIEEWRKYVLAKLF
nr:GNAT family N-acetyltransferase [uncultured Haemophilus sp.]